MIVRSSWFAALALLALCASCAPSSPVVAAPSAAAPSAAAPSYAPPRYDSGRFTVSMQGGRAWFLAPDGQRFLSQGVNHVGSSGDRAPNPNFYDPVDKQFAGDKQAWVKSAFERLSGWGFNTVGAWSDQALYGQHYPYTFILYAAGFDQPLEHAFDPVFESRVAANIEKARSLKDDPYLIGYFLDNELPWWGEVGWHAGGQKSLLEKYAHAELGGGGKRVLREFLERRYQKDISSLNRAYHTSLKSFDEIEQSIELPVRGPALRRDADDFAGVVAERFFSVTTRALRERDASHLNLCVRFAGETPWPVVEVAGRYCDVVSVNQYQRTGDIDRRLLDDFYVKTHKPILLTEYSFSATENQSGDPNTKGASVTVPTQRERAEHTERFAKQALALPYVVGMHWFEWADESPEGRFDGENQDYGLVDIQDRPYALLTESHRALNRDAQAIHRASALPLPVAFAADPEPTLHTSVPPKPLSAPLPFYARGSRPKTVSWGDAANGGVANVSALLDAELIQYDSGAGWGAGVTILPLVAPFDASGAGHLELSAEIPATRSLQVFLSEVGVAAPGQNQYAGLAGSDGESYEFPALVGTGKLETYVIDLHQLERRSSWGNQRGNQVLDLQALSAVDLDIPGKQGTGEIRVVAITFTP